MNIWIQDLRISIMTIIFFQNNQIETDSFTKNDASVMLPHWGPYYSLGRELWVEEETTCLRV